MQCIKYIISLKWSFFLANESENTHYYKSQIETILIFHLLNNFYLSLWESYFTFSCNIQYSSEYNRIKRMHLLPVAKLNYLLTYRYKGKRLLVYFYFFLFPANILGIKFLSLIPFQKIFQSFLCVHSHNTQYLSLKRKYVKRNNLEI